MVIFAVVIAVQSRKEIAKDYIAEETHVELETSNQSETTNVSEKQEEWVDADGNPIIGND